MSVAIDSKQMQDIGNHGKQLQVGGNSNCNGKQSQVGNSNSSSNGNGKRSRTEDIGSQNALPACTPSHVVEKSVLESCDVGNASGKGKSKSKSKGNALGVGGNSNGNSNNNTNDNNDDGRRNLHIDEQRG